MLLKSPTGKPFVSEPIEHWVKASTTVCTLFQVLLYTPDIQSSFVSHCIKLLLRPEGNASRTDEEFLAAKVKFDQQNDELIISKIIGE